MLSLVALLALNIDPCMLANPANIRVPAQCPTIAAAVGRVSNGGTIQIAAGEYRENLTVGGKTVNFVGAGSATTRLVGAAGSPALFLGGGGGATVSGLTIRGGSAAIEGRTVLGMRPGSLTVSNARLVQTPYGVKGDFGGPVFVGDTAIEPTQRGIDLVSVPDFDLVRSSILGGGLGGLSVRVPTGSAGCLVLLDQVEQSFSGGIGALIGGKGCPVDIRNSRFNLNTQAGIWLNGAGTTTISASSVQFAYAQADGRFGDGIVVASTHATVSGTTVDRPARAGMSLFGCASGAAAVDGASLRLQNDTLNGAAFDLDLERGRVTPTTAAACPAGSGWPSLEDLGGNVCDGGACRAESSEIVPIAAP